MANRSIKEIASATISAAKEEKLVARIIDDMRLFSEMLQLNPSLIHLLQDGLIDLGKRVQALDKATGDSLHKYSKNSIAVLIQNNRLSEFNTFIQALETQAREVADHYECTVVTAIEINDEKVSEIKKALEKKFTGTVRIQTEIDSNIIGGMTVKCGDWKYQSTIQSKLQQLHNHLVIS
jgi:F-type H+-transporting ATPase subunit delta